MKRKPKRTGRPERPRREDLKRIALWLGWVAAVALAAALAAGSCRPAAAAISDCLDATCRITAADGGRGTGCVFEISQGHVYVLTAAHVVGIDAKVQCEFWRLGHQSQPLAGEVVLRAEGPQSDVAVVAIPEERFGGLLPAAIPVAPREYVVRPGETLVSVGCANGAWSTGWKGHALGYSGTDLYFTPPPAQGRSGSALFDADGRRIVGLVRARTADDQLGIAWSLQALYGQLGQAAAARRVQCGPGGCGPGACPAPQYRLLPYRQQQEFQQWRSASPWPTLPGADPRSDLSETNRKLDELGRRLEATERARERPEAKKDDGLNPWLAGAVALLAVLGGAALFYATQTHSPISGG